MEIAARFVRLVIIFGLTALAVRVAPAGAQIPAFDPKHYENEKYQFSVDLPRGLPACVSEHTNHGVVIYLDRAVKCGDPDKGVAYIGIFANYNSWEVRTLARLARIGCGPSPFEPVPRRVEWVRGAMLGGRKATGCRQYFVDGGVAVSIITLRKTDGPVSGWIEVAGYLKTTVQRHKDDMRIFGEVLRTVWIHPDGSDD
jgi:hypothetical protein